MKARITQDTCECCGQPVSETVVMQMTVREAEVLTALVGNSMGASRAAGHDRPAGFFGVMQNVAPEGGYNVSVDGSYKVEYQDSENVERLLKELEE